MLTVAVGVPDLCERWLSRLAATAEEKAPTERGLKFTFQRGTNRCLHNALDYDARYIARSIKRRGQDFVSGHSLAVPRVLGWPALAQEAVPRAFSDAAQLLIG
jgi:hypothetical protein